MLMLKIKLLKSIKIWKKSGVIFGGFIGIY